MARHTNNPDDFETHNPDEEPEEQPQIDPVLEQQQKEAHREAVIKCIKKHADLEEDEIKALFATDADMDLFHEEMHKLKSIPLDDEHLTEGDDENDKNDQDEDDTEISSDDSRRIQELKDLKKSRSKRKKMSPAKRKAFDQAGAHLGEGKGNTLDLDRLLEQVEDEEE